MSVSSPVGVAAVAVIVAICITAVVPETAEAQTANDGKFTLEYYANPNSPYEFTALDDLQTGALAGLLDEEVYILNERYNLPYDITVITEECGEPNAFYDPVYREVIMCYEYLDELYNHTTYWDVDEYYYYDNVLVTFYHEIGHAFQDILGLLTDEPDNSIQEEIQADQFASYTIYNEFMDEYMTEQHILMNVQDWFYIVNEGDEESLTYYSETHPTDQERIDDISCFLYGSDPINNAFLTTSSAAYPISPSDANQCIQKFEQVKRFWDVSLESYRVTPIMSPPQPTTPIDTTPPTITLLGGNIEITQGEPYTELGAQCIDDTDGIITTTLSGTVDTSRIGTQTITYTCTDSSSNQATTTRTITVIAPTPTPEPEPENAPEQIQPTTDTITEKPTEPIRNPTTAINTCR